MRATRSSTYDFLAKSVISASLLMGLASSPDALASQRAEHVNSVDRLCGRLVHVKYLGTDREKLISITDATVRLCKRIGETDCCAGETPLAETVSKRGGNFEFKDVPAGKYCVTAVLAGREHTLPIECTRAARNSEPTSCSTLLYRIDEKGRFTLGMIIQVD
jgi:hypothetical protein